jgi:hypothetical protein
MNQSIKMVSISLAAGRIRLLNRRPGFERRQFLGKI